MPSPFVGTYSRFSVECKLPERLGVFLLTEIEGAGAPESSPWIRDKDFHST